MRLCSDHFQGIERGIRRSLSENGCMPSIPFQQKTFTDVQVTRGHILFPCGWPTDLLDPSRKRPSRWEFWFVPRDRGCAPASLPHGGSLPTASQTWHLWSSKVLLPTAFLSASILSNRAPSSSLQVRGRRLWRVCARPDAPALVARGCARKIVCHWAG
jgi:hypothetical protein